MHEMADREKPGVCQCFVISGTRRAVVCQETLQTHPQGRQRNIKWIEAEMNEGESQVRAVR